MSMYFTRPALAGLAIALAAGCAALAQESPGATSTPAAPAAAPVAPAPPPARPIQINRFVPSGEERTIWFFAANFPDCSSRGPTVARVLEKPEHGDASLVAGDSFPAFGSNSPLASCNSRKTQGLMVNYRSAPDYTGEDRLRLFVIFPDGSGGEWNYTLIVK